MLYPIENKVREVKNLNGIWNFRIDTDNAGIEQKWYEQPLTDVVPMAVPASYNDLFTDARLKEHVGYVWYEREFIVPDSWTDKRIVVRFGSATHHARVYLDGIEVVRHKGGFLPFETDITELLETSGIENHRLTVALSNVLDWTCLPCGEVITEEGSKYPEGYHYQESYFDFYNYSGIHRPVKIYATPKNYIRDITIKTEVEGLSPDFSDEKPVTIKDYKKLEELPTANKATVKVWVESTDEIQSVKIIDENNEIVCEKEITQSNVIDSLKDAKDSSNDVETYFAEVEVTNPKLWNPGATYLYKLCVEGKEDIYTEEFGIRTIETTDKQFKINGKPFYFKGFGRHEDSDIHGKGLDEALNIRDFNLLDWIGANSFRTSHYPYSEEQMMLADREGIVVIDEVPAVGMCFWDGQSVFAGGKVSDETLEHHLDVLSEMYQRDKNHPSVVMWSVANEAATHEEGAALYFEKVTSTMKGLDDTRPITIVHTTGPDGDKVSQWVDVICVNRYYAWYNDHGHLDVIGLQLKEEMDKWHAKYNKPIIMSEYGADTIAGYHKLPAVAFTEEFQCEYLDEYHKVFDQLEYMIGEHVWAYCDFQTKQGLNRVDGNKKGVFTRNRQPKAAAHLLRKRWK
ncbi:MAG: beta-glucuronidase [Eubacterium sp.]|nr:beta-glucuronidase [Eubacterium sp.]